VIRPIIIRTPSFKFRQSKKTKKKKKRKRR